MKPNNYCIVDGQVLLELSQGQTTVIDVEDLDKALQYRWYAVWNDSIRGYYAVAHPDNTTLYLHRHLLDAPSGMTVDHFNHDTLDNRRNNLRLVTNQKNCENRKGAYSTSKLGIRGVSVATITNTRGNKTSTTFYVFRCHGVNCKVAKYFPYTEEGLATAQDFAEKHYAAMQERAERCL